ncbi:N-formylglutamate amidohydrolase [Mesorhizobium sp. SB112]|uniref:N-formylglutamate amidohydrolase n=1 Tax=Mesorhizobium sp. SB112 TaxID=3151853 RepID=UPI00326653E2
MISRRKYDGWEVELGNSPVIGTAIHAGSQLRKDWRELMCISDSDRLREEDPFTDSLIEDFPNRVVVHRSRFEVDLNRARADAVYQRPEQAWGLQVWSNPPDESCISTSLGFHDDFYNRLENILSDIEALFGKFVVIDVHSYNHRRAGPNGPSTAQEIAPDVNIGTYSMDRKRWSFVVDPLIEILGNFEFRGRPLDVRENIAFFGKGEHTRFVHHRFPQTGCAIAVEFKKVFMDEWTGEPDDGAICELRRMLAATVPLLETTLLAGR